MKAGKAILVSDQFDFKAKGKKAKWTKQNNEKPQMRKYINKKVQPFGNEMTLLKITILCKKEKDTNLKL